MIPNSAYSYPLEFRDVHYVAITYTSSFDAINAKLFGTGLKAGLVFNGKPLVAVGLIEYKDSDLGAYNEVIIAIPVVPMEYRSNILNWLELYYPFSSRRLGQYILHIPVTSEKSMMAGKELWGYPKIVRKIDHSLNHKKINSCIWSESGHKKIIEFTGASAFGFPLPNMNLMTYSHKNNEMMKTTVDVRANMRWKMFSDIRIKLNDMTDPICKDINELGICNKKPLFTLEATKFSAKFNEGIIVG